MGTGRSSCCDRDVRAHKHGARFAGQGRNEFQKDHAMRRTKMKRALSGVVSAAIIAAGIFLATRLEQPAAAPNASLSNQLAFENNFFVTGDYVVAGAYGMTSHITNGFATGTI